MKVTTAGWTPKWFSQYRFYLSILVGTCIISTLFGINYLGPTTDVALAEHLHQGGGLGSSGTLMDRNVRDKEVDRVPTVIKDDAQFRTESGGEMGQGYVNLIKRKDEGEGEGGEGDEDVGTPGDNAGAPGDNPNGYKEMQEEDIKGEKKSKGPNEKLQGNGGEKKK